MADGLPKSKTRFTSFGRLMSGPSPPDGTEAEADGLLDPPSALLMPSDDLSPPPQAVSRSAAVAVKAAAVAVRAWRATVGLPRSSTVRRVCSRERSYQGWAQGT